MRTLALVLILGLSSATFGKTTPEQNKKIVTAFYTLTFVEHKPEKAVELYVGDKYIQHNPRVPDGSKAFLDFFVPFFKTHPDQRAEITQTIADGDLVALHVHAKTNKEDRGRAVVDIFRVENGKIVEHWDVVQDVPEKSANTNTMF
jgi:predicted SnoaL-like aldol condensation-catalyzing enzyme